MKRTIITISRQFGSGGRTIGAQLARELDIPFYDKELISLAAKKSGIEERIFENADKQAVSSLLYSLSMGMYNVSSSIIDRPDVLPLNDRVFIIQHNVIRDLAQKGSCVIVGRCADYVLREDPDAVHVFIHSDLENRVRRAVEDYQFPSEKAAASIQKADKRRAAYYEYYTGRRWGRMDQYDFAFNSDRVGLENVVGFLRDWVLRTRQD